MKRNKKKKQKTKLSLCAAARLARTLTIREFAKLIGDLVASMEAVPYGRRFYRQLERDKIKSVQQNKGNFEAQITLLDLSIKRTHLVGKLYYDSHQKFEKAANRCNNIH